MRYQLSSGSAQGALLETLTLGVLMCDHEVDRPLQHIGIGCSVDKICYHLPKIPLVQVSPMTVRKLVNTYAEEKAGVGILRGKLTFCLGIEETNFIQRDSDGICQVQDPFCGAKNISNVSGSRPF